MSYELRPLQVVVVSQQVSLLHEISWILEAVGYKVQTTNDFGQDALWRRFSTAVLGRSACLVKTEVGSRVGALPPRLPRPPNLNVLSRRQY